MRTAHPPPFQTLLDAHGRDVHRFLTALVGRDDADDCYQETWLAALRAYADLRDAANLRGWVLTIAHRKGLDRIRRRGREPASIERVVDGAPPEDQNTRDEELWSLVRALPEKQRTAIALRFVLDAGYEQISVAMQTSEEAARRNVHEGLKRLRTEYRA